MFTTGIEDRIMRQTKSGNKIYWMITQERGAPNFELRYIEIPPRGKSSSGSHPHEHEVFIVKGKGQIIGSHLGGGPYVKDLSPNMAVFVPGDEPHQWVNMGDEPFGFICVVPKGAEADSKPSCCG